MGLCVELGRRVVTVLASPRYIELVVDIEIMIPIMHHSSDLGSSGQNTLLKIE